MKQGRIKSVFNGVFNNMPNPIFCHVIRYFQVGNFLCELARSITMRECRWGNYEHKLMSPLLILEGLFVTNEHYITVLEKKDKEIVKREDLCQTIKNNKELQSFINKLKGK